MYNYKYVQPNPNHGIMTFLYHLCISIHDAVSYSLSLTNACSSSKIVEKIKLIAHAYTSTP